MDYIRKTYRFIFLVSLLYIGLDGIIISYIPCLQDGQPDKPKTEFYVIAHHHHHHEENKLVKAESEFAFYPSEYLKLNHHIISIPSSYTPPVWQPPKL